jgi:Immunity protein 63
MYSLLQIEKMVEKVNENLVLPKNWLPAYGSDYGNRPYYVTIDNDCYSLIGFGYYRNKEDDHLIARTKDIDELLFAIFMEATTDIAIKYELDNRLPNQDTRILYFNKHIEILNSLQLEKKLINELKEYYDYLLKSEEPLPRSNIQERFPDLLKKYPSFGGDQVAPS